MAPRRSRKDESDDVEYVPLPARKGLSVPDFNLNALLHDTRSSSHSTPAPTATATGSSSSRPLQSAPSAPSAPASLVVPSRFQASEESSPEQGAGGKKSEKKEKDKTGKTKKDKKTKKEKKTAKKTNEDDDEDDEGCEADHEPLGGNGDDDDEGDGFGDLDGYDELVSMQESKGPKKRPATSKAAAPRKKPATKHSEVPPFHHMIEGAEMGECRKSVEPMEPADGGDMNYPTQEYVLPEPELELPMSPADGYCTAGGSSCYAETFKDPASPAFSYHPDNQLGLEDTPDPHAVTPDGNTDAGHEGSPTSADLTAVLDGVEPRAIDLEAADGSEDAIDKSSLSERWGITRVDPEGAEPAPDGARDRTVATPARSTTAKPKVRPSPKVGAKAKAGKTAKAKAKASPKRKAADKVKKVAIAKHKARRSKKVSPECKASPKAAPKHKMRKDKDEVERKLHSVYSGAHKEAKTSGHDAAHSKLLAAGARLKWAAENGPADHPAIIALLRSS